MKNFKRWNIGCDCPNDAEKGERCTKDIIRCNGALKTRSDYMKSIGCGFWGEPLKELVKENHDI